MTREEYNKISAEALAEVGNEKPDNGKISEMLAKLRDGFAEEVTAKETAEKSAADFKAANESLQAANMALFLKSGQILKEKGESDLEKITQKEKPSFDSLFDENGELI